MNLLIISFTFLLLLLLLATPTSCQWFSPSVFMNTKYSESLIDAKVMVDSALVLLNDEAKKEAASDFLISHIINLDVADVAFIWMTAYN